MAAEGGHLDVLVWLRENGCQWNHLTCAEAACGGHLEVLRWAVANGCPWDAQRCLNEASHGNPVAEWIESQL